MDDKEPSAPAGAPAFAAPEVVLKLLKVPWRGAVCFYPEQLVGLAGLVKSDNPAAVGRLTPTAAQPESALLAVPSSGDATLAANLPPAFAAMPVVAPPPPPRTARRRIQPEQVGPVPPAKAGAGAESGEGPLLNSFNAVLWPAGESQPGPCPGLVESRGMAGGDSARPISKAISTAAGELGDRASFKHPEDMGTDVEVAGPELNAIASPLASSHQELTAGGEQVYLTPTEVPNGANIPGRVEGTNGGKETHASDRMPKATADAQPRKAEKASIETIDGKCRRCMASERHHCSLRTTCRGYPCMRACWTPVSSCSGRRECCQEELTCLAMVGRLVKLPPIDAAPFTHASTRSFDADGPSLRTRAWRSLHPSIAVFTDR